MLSTLRSGKGVCNWTSITKFKPRMVCAHTNSGRTLFTGQVGRRGAQQVLKRYSANEAKTTVRAMPVETTRAGLTGIHACIC